jgi:shikimate kinase
VLVGLPGVGKTAVARALALDWGSCALDTDDLLSERVGVSAAQYLREEGEAAFRANELDALEEALMSDCVVATGAGVVTIEAARTLLVEELTLWLDADDVTLLARVASGERPLLGDDHQTALSELRTNRELWYRTCSRERVDASGDLADVVRRVRDLAQEVAP